MFLLYAADLVGLIQRHGLSSHLYADDTQVYGTCRPSDVGALIGRLSECMDDIASWIASNRLQLNADKTELLWFHTSGRTCNPVTPFHFASALSSSCHQRSFVIWVCNPTQIFYFITRSV